MVEKVNEMIKEMEVAEKYLMGMLRPEDLAGALDDEGIKVFKSYVKLMQLSKDLMLGLAIHVDSTDHKLSNINERLQLISDQLDRIEQK